jgi:hypothetical protein
MYRNQLKLPKTAPENGHPNMSGLPVNDRSKGWDGMSQKNCPSPPAFVGWHTPRENF